MSFTTEYASQSATITEVSPAAPDAGSQFMRLDGTALSQLRVLLDVEHGIPIDEEADAEEAILYLYKSAAWPVGAVDVTISRTDAEWDAATATWNDQPGVIAGGLTISVAGSGAAGDEIALDITALIDAAHTAEDAGTAAYNGLRIEIADAGERQFYGAAVSDPTFQPRLEVEWNVPPDEPTNLVPNDGLAVSSTQPELFCDFTDDDADDYVSGIHLQIDDVDTMATPSYDSGELLHDRPSFDLADPPTGAPVTPVLGAGPHYYRFRVRDKRGAWSDWSDVASFVVVAKGTLSLTAPVVLDSPIPVITHDLDGDVQSEVEVSVERLEDGVWQEHYFLARHESAEVDHQVPDAKLLEEGFTWRLSKKVWPVTAYDDVPGDREFYEAELILEFA